MPKKMGRPPVENPKNQKLSLRFSDEDFQDIEEARSKDKNPDRSLSGWASRKLAELARKMIGKK